MRLVGETLQRPLQEAIKQGVEEALEEQATVTREESEQQESSGRSWLPILALVGIGALAVVAWRRRSGGGGGSTESIREQSKTATGSGHETPGTSGGAVGVTESSIESEDAAPEAGSEGS